MARFHGLGDLAGVLSVGGRPHDGGQAVIAQSQRQHLRRRGRRPVHRQRDGKHHRVREAAVLADQMAQGVEPGHPLDYDLPVVEKHAGNVDDRLQVAPGIAPQVDDQGLDAGIEQGPELPGESTVGACAEGAETQIAGLARHGPARCRRLIHQVGLDHEGHRTAVPFDIDPHEPARLEAAQAAQAAARPRTGHSRPAITRCHRPSVRPSPAGLPAYTSATTSRHLSDSAWQGTVPSSRPRRRPMPE